MSDHSNNILTVSVRDTVDVETLLINHRAQIATIESGGPRLDEAIEDMRRTEDDVVTSESREKTFEDLLLTSAVLQGLNNSGFVRPSPVQLQAIPKAKVGFDCIVQSKSGTGKTCVYVVTALEMVKPELSALQVLVLS